MQHALTLHSCIAIITIILAKSPTRVYPPPRDKRVPSRVGGLLVAGGSGESHLTTKQTRNDTFTVFTTTTHTLTFTHSLTTIHLNTIYWTDFGSICSIWWWYCGWWFPFRLLSGSLAKCSHLPLPDSSEERTTLLKKFSLSEVCARLASIQENGRKRANDTGWAHGIATLPILCTFCLYRGFGFPLLALNWVTSCHLPLGFPFWHRTASFTAMPRLDVYWVCLTCSPFCGISLFHRAFTTSLSCVAASFARQT